MNSNNENIIQISEDCKLIVPDNPVIPFIEGDGVGPEVTSSMIKIVNHSVNVTYNKKRSINWLEVFAGEKANKIFKKDIWLPQETLDAISKYKIAIKGPLMTPTGGGQRSLNVRLRQKLDLYVCQRPIKWFEGVPSPVITPQAVDMIVFRENSEDIYSGIEWPHDSNDVKKVIHFLKNEMGVENIIDSDNCGIGIKNMSSLGSKRLIKAAIEYAIEHDRSSVTVVHKGNIMKFTEGAFLNWGIDLILKKYHGFFDKEKKCYKFKNPNNDKDIIFKDCICDAFLQNILLKPKDYDVIATTNLNGDYVSDSLAACVGGIGISPGANINYTTGEAVFEATHGTAPDIAGENIVNPSSLILSAEMMLRYLGWNEAANNIMDAIEKVIKQKTVTADFAYQMENATLCSCSEFTDLIIEKI
ncbi:MAG: NADP-dependent isocitrate dehydrogenase [Verrucomicrobiota bacterium]|nr:NADP-dependent isocitrate dehydrogenase [Verrucomicrobiota bacterium]